MALFGLNIFDKATEGMWTESSSCGFNKECQKAKACAANVCAQARALYGESVYTACLQQCQADPRPGDMNAVLCNDPMNAWLVWGYQCPGFDPETAKRGLKVGNKTISWYIIGSILVLAIIIAILIWL